MCNYHNNLLLVTIVVVRRLSCMCIACGAGRWLLAPPSKEYGKNIHVDAAAIPSKPHRHTATPTYAHCGFSLLGCLCAEAKKMKSLTLDIYGCMTEKHHDFERHVIMRSVFPLQSKTGRTLIS